MRGRMTANDSLQHNKPVAKKHGGDTVHDRGLGHVPAVTGHDGRQT